MTAFDTNILIYSCDQSDPIRKERAFQVLTAADDGVILWQVAVEFIAASRKLSPQGFTARQAWARLREFRSVFPLILPSSNALDRAEILHRDHGLSFWDSAVIGACLDHGITTLYSADLPGKSFGPTLRVVNPFLANGPV